MRLVSTVAACAALLAASPVAQAAGKRMAKDAAVAAADTAWKPMNPQAPDGPQLAILWGDMNKAPVGFLLKVKAGITFPKHSHTHSYDAVVIQGEWKHTYGDAADAPALPAGSHWHQTGKQVHGDGCASSASGECIVLVSYPRGKRDFIPAKK
jgi:quercetin dioxygenase-like cupin family protein